MQSRLSLLLILALGALGFTAFWWFATQSSKSRFLPLGGTAEWILYPVPPETNIQRSVDRNATFRRTFTLDAVPTTAQLQVKAFERFRVQVNGNSIKELTGDGVKWKQVARQDVARTLRRGTNEILVTVTSSVGPPALWLWLAGDGWSLSSDEKWVVSLEGAVERPARSASAPLEIRAGNTIAGGERTTQSLVAKLPLLGSFAAISCAIVAALYFWNRRTGKRHAFAWTRFTAHCALIGIALLWLTLFWNNLRSLNFPLGFDVTGHLDYIRYIQERKALPLADQGWAMHHPPLYHILSAIGLGACRLSVTDPGAAVFLRLFSLAMGIAQIALVFGCLRLVFPDKPAVQAIGLILCAFLPVQLYLFHYVTNETLATTLGTAVLYVCLRILRDEHTGASRGASAPGGLLSLYVLLGAVLGAALLTKVTALMLLVVVSAVLVGRLLVQKQRSPGLWLKTIGATLLVCFVMSGWHYVRVWAHFGTPLVGNYDPASGFTWWQDPGCSTASYYLRFGHSLVEPYFSGFNSFADGFYSTLWCDALWGGVSEREMRPPWNYDLMTAGCLLAIVPNLAILAGAIAALVQLVRRPRADWFLLFGVVFAMAIGILYQCLRFPYYGHAKAFYALSGVASVCAFGGLGFEMFARSWRGGWSVTALIVGLWAATAYASFWVVNSAAATQAWMGNKCKETGRDADASVHFRYALQIEPNNVDARLGLMDLLARNGSVGEASRHLLQALHDNPNNARVHLQMAKALEQENPQEALQHIERAVQLAPDHVQAFRVLGSLLDRLGKPNAAIDAYRHGLANLPTGSLTHRDLAALLARSGKTAAAIEHYRASLRLWPDKPLVMDRLAWILATCEDARFRDAGEAIRLAEEACRLTGDRDPVLLDTLAAAFAEAGRFDDAKRVEKMALASTSGQNQLYQEMEKRLKMYEAEKPYHESRPSAMHGSF